MKSSSSSLVPTLVDNGTPVVSSLAKANRFAGQLAANSSVPESEMTSPVLERVIDSMGQIFFRTRAGGESLKGSQHT